MKAKLVALLAFLRARAAESSSRAAVAAFLTAVAGGLATLGSLRSALILFGAAGVAAINAAMKADPSLASELGPIAREAEVVLPIVAQVATVAVPGRASAIAEAAALAEKAAADLSKGA